MKRFGDFQIILIFVLWLQCMCMSHCCQRHAEAMAKRDKKSFFSFSIITAISSMADIHVVRIWDVLFLGLHCTLLNLGFRAFFRQYVPGEWRLLSSCNQSTGRFQILQNQVECKAAFGARFCIVLYIQTSLELQNSPPNLQVGKWCS